MLHPRLRPLVAALLLGPLAACGGGGGAGGGAGSGVVDLGNAASTVPTTYLQTFTNPLGVGATAEALPAPVGSRFEVAPSFTPQPAGAGAGVGVPVVFTPASVGTVEGAVSVRFAAGGQEAVVTQTFRATAEAVVWTVTPPTLDFGIVLPGTSADRAFTFRNTSSLSPVTLSAVLSPSPAFTLVTPSLPLVVAPGSTVAGTLRFAPVGEGGVQGTFAIGVGTPGGPVPVGVTGDTAPREVVTDFGSVAVLAGGDTGDLTVQVPADAISLSLEARGTTADLLGLALLTGPGGKVYENTTSTGAYIWNSGQEVFSTHVPNTDRTDVQLVPGGGTYTFRIRRLQGGSPSVAVRAIVERRPGGSTTTGTLDLNVWLAQGLSVDAASAPTDATLQAVLARLDQILEAQGVSLGAITYYDVNDPTYDFVTNAEFPGLLRLSSGAAERRLNLFFVREAIGGGVVGVAGTIDGPQANGTGVSGVMSVGEGFSASTIGLVAAHEIGHFLGLYHTVEQSGTHDFVDDTAECPATGTGTGTCATAGGGYLMHWQAVGGTTITNGQALVVRGHPLLAPGSTPAPKPAVPLPTAEELVELGSLPAGWCATCGRVHAPQKPR